MFLLLSLAYLFFVGSVLGWVLELFFRKFFSSSNPEHRWINPGFCTGPYVPLYGCGLCALYLLALAGERLGADGAPMGRLGLVLCMAAVMTVIEYITGLFCLKVLKLRLWDYSRRPGNIQGLICPLFSLIWGLLGAAYYYLVDPYVLEALSWLNAHMAFCFVIGFFFGVFTLDVAWSFQLVARLKRFAEENDVIVRYENLKANIRRMQETAREKTHFLFPFRGLRSSLNEHLQDAYGVLEKLRKNVIAGAEALRGGDSSDK